MDIDMVIDEIASRHLGLVPRSELRAAGVDARAVARRVARGTLEVLSPRVLRHVAAPRTDAQRALAGCLDVPGGAALSFDTAAWWWGAPGFALGAIEVTARRDRPHDCALALVHRPTRHLEHHLVVVRGMLVTDLPWTVFNLASRHHPKRIARLIDTIGARSPSFLLAMHRLLPQMVGKGMTGCVVVRDLLAERPPGIRLPGSGVQRRFEEVMAAAGITGLRREVDLGGHEWIGRVDYRCELTNAVVEVDSELHHTSPTDVAADAARDAALIAAGAPEVLRIWTETIWSNPAEAVAAVRSMRSRVLSTPSMEPSAPEKEMGEAS